MSLVETLPDDQYLAWWRKRRAEIPRPVVKAITRRDLTAATYAEKHTVPTYAEWRAANTQTFPWKHTAPTYEQYLVGLMGAAPGAFGRILLDVAVRHEVTIQDLISGSRERHICHARQEAMWMAHANTRLSMPSIGKRLGGRDHTTVMHGIRAHARRMALRAKA